MFEIHPSISLFDFHNLVNLKFQLGWVLVVALLVLCIGLNIHSSSPLIKRVIISVLLLSISFVNHIFLFVGIIELIFLVQTLFQERNFGEIGPPRSATYLVYLLLAFLGMYQGSLVLSQFQNTAVVEHKFTYLSFYLLIMWQMGLFEPIYKRLSKQPLDKLAIKWPIQMSYLVLFFKTALPIAKTSFLQNWLTIFISIALLAHLVDFLESSKLRKIISHQYQFFKICIVFALLCSNLSLAVQLFLMFSFLFVILIYLTQVQNINEVGASEEKSKQVIASLNYGVLLVSFLALCGFPFTPGFWLFCNIVWISSIHSSIFFSITFLIALAVLLFKTVDALMLLKNMEERTKQLGSRGVVVPILIMIIAFALSIMNLPSSFGSEISDLFGKTLKIDGMPVSIAGKENLELIAITLFAAFVLIVVATRIFITDTIVKIIAILIQTAAKVISVQASRLLVLTTSTIDLVFKKYTSGFLKGQMKAEEVCARGTSKGVRVIIKFVNPDHLLLLIIIIGLSLILFAGGLK